MAMRRIELLTNVNVQHVIRVIGKLEVASVNELPGTRIWPMLGVRFSVTVREIVGGMGGWGDAW